MALQIWLPLNKENDFKSRGLLNNIFSKADGPIYNSSGKIGGCYSFDGSNDNLYSVTDKSFWGGKEISFACWFKSDKTKTGGTLIEIGADLTLSYAYNSYGIRFAYWRSYSNNGNRTGDSQVNPAYYNADLWHHVVVTFDHLYNKMYVDGQLSKEWDLSSLYTTNWVPLLALTAYKNIAIGRSYGSTSFIGGLINDVRIYDHCLSAQEIKEISKGLVLHYPLNDTLVLTNAFNYPTFNTSAASGGWSHWGPSGATASWSLNTNKDYIFNKNNIYSHKFLHTGGSYYIVHQSPAFEGGYRSALAIIKMEGGEYPHNIAFSQNATVGTDPPTTFTALGDGFYLMKHEGFRQDGSNDLVSIWINNNVTVYISEVYLENDRQVCSNLFKTTNVVYDSSGYNNNGTIIGTLTNSTDTPRYDKCSQGNGNISCSGLTINNPFTISTWIYLPTTGTTGSGNELTIGPVNLYKDHDGVDKHTFSVTKSDNSPAYLTTFYPPEDKWYHLAIVSDGSTLKIYKNGVASTNSISTKDGKTNFSIMLSNNIKLSDLRLYATALSDSDIKALYQEVAFIDYKGNVGCYLFYEDGENSKELLPIPTSGVTFNSDGSYLVNGRTWPPTDYIPINPSGKTYYYDIEYSNLNSGNYFLIGFEKYDANKASGSNSECLYLVSTTSVTDHTRVTGTVNLATANGTTAAFTKLRILNNWNSASGTNQAIIHHISLKEVSTLTLNQINKQGLIKSDAFIEGDSATISKHGNVTANQLIEI